MSVDVSADVHSTWAALTSASWPSALAAALHDGSRLVTAEVTPAGGAVIVVSRQLPARIPGFLSTLAPPDGRVTQTDRWGPAVDGVRRGTWEVSYPGSPGTMAGEVALEPTAAGCHYVVTGSVTIRVPLLGGRAEGFLAPLLEKLVVRQGAVLREQVGGPRDA